MRSCLVVVGLALSLAASSARAESLSGSGLRPLSRYALEAGARGDQVLLRCAGLEMLLAHLLRAQRRHRAFEATKRRGAAFLATYATLHSLDAAGASASASRFAEAYRQAMKAHLAEDGASLPESWFAEDLARCLDLYRRVLPRIPEPGAAASRARLSG